MKNVHQINATERVVYYKRQRKYGHVYTLQKYQQVTYLLIFNCWKWVDIIGVSYSGEVPPFEKTLKALIDKSNFNPFA